MTSETRNLLFCYSKNEIQDKFIVLQYPSNSHTLVTWCHSGCGYV